MQIFVEYPNKQPIPINITRTSTVSTLRGHLNQKLVFIPVTAGGDMPDRRILRSDRPKINLKFNNKLLEDQEILSECGVQDQSTVQASMELQKSEPKHYEREPKTRYRTKARRRNENAKRAGKRAHTAGEAKGRVFAEPMTMPLPEREVGIQENDAAACSQTMGRLPGSRLRQEINQVDQQEYQDEEMETSPMQSPQRIFGSPLRLETGSVARKSGGIWIRPLEAMSETPPLGENSVEEDSMPEDYADLDMIEGEEGYNPGIWEDGSQANNSQDVVQAETLAEENDPTDPFDDEDANKENRDPQILRPRPLMPRRRQVI